MQPFTPSFQHQEWDSGVSALHLYVRPDPAVDTDLFALIAECRTVLHDYPVWCLPDDMVHITVEMDAYAPSTDICTNERTRLVAALKARLIGIEPFTMLCGSPIANRTGAILDTYPDQGLGALRNMVRNALWEVHDGPAIAYKGGRGHVSLGYAYGSANSDPLQSELRMISPSHAWLTVSHLHLIDVCWTAHPKPDGGARWEMTWEPVVVLPLGTKPRGV